MWFIISSVIPPHTSHQDHTFLLINPSFLTCSRNLALFFFLFFSIISLTPHPKKEINLFPYIPSPISLKCSVRPFFTNFPPLPNCHPRLSNQKPHFPLPFSQKKTKILPTFFPLKFPAFHPPPPPNPINSISPPFPSNSRPNIIPFPFHLTLVLLLSSPFRKLIFLQRNPQCPPQFQTQSNTVKKLLQQL